MNLIEKAKGIFKKTPKVKDRIYIGANPDFPHGGLSVFSEDKIIGPSFCVEGITLAQARVDLCGKVIDWSKMTPLQAEAIKAGGKVTLPLSALQSLFR